MSMKLVAFHAFAVVLYMGSTYYNAHYVKVPSTKEFDKFHAFGGLTKYLTLWNMIIQSVFFWICVANDFFGSNEISPKVTPAIRKFKDILFCSIAFPLSAFVAVTFWGLYAIDRELVLPKVMDDYFPTWLNHIMHTNILIFTLIELVSTFRIYPPRKDGISILTGLMFVYLIWVFIIYFKSEHWVYPVLDVLNWPQRFLFFICLLFAANGFYLLGEFLNKTVWDQQLKAALAASCSSSNVGKKRSN